MGSVARRELILKKVCGPRKCSKGGEVVVRVRGEKEVERSRTAGISPEGTSLKGEREGGRQDVLLESDEREN